MPGESYYGLGLYGRDQYGTSPYISFSGSFKSQPVTSARFVRVKNSRAAIGASGFASARAEKMTGLIGPIFVATELSAKYLRRRNSQGILAPQFWSKARAQFVVQIELSGAMWGKSQLVARAAVTKPISATVYYSPNLAADIYGGPFWAKENETDGDWQGLPDASTIWVKVPDQLNPWG